MNKKTGITRREFLKWGAAGALGAASMGTLSAFASNSENPQENTLFESNIDWDAEYDVIVIGFGGAGAAAAIAAADKGAKVLILEKAPLGEEGGNTRYAGQLVLCPTDRDKALTYYTILRGKYENQTDDILELIVDGTMANREWLLELGADPDTLGTIDYIEYPQYDGSDSIQSLLIDGELYTAAFWRLLRDNVTQRADKIAVWYESPAVKLIQDPDSRIVHGVVVENASSHYNVRAKNGVIMAPGGFENSDDMLENYCQLSNAYSKGARYNTGDGVKMAIQAGADLWHMSALSGPDVNFVIPETGVSAGYYLTYTNEEPYYTGFTAHNTIIVGGDGTRFMSETDTPKHGHVNRSGTYFSLQIPDNSYCIFDEAARTAIPAYAAWSDGMTEEIEKGWIVQADTIPELAEKIGINAAVLENTVTTFNTYCENGEDLDWHVPQEYLKPLDTSPYYAFPVHATLTNTQGGAKRNTDCEVLDVNGEVIPHLYSAGEFGSFYTDIYNGGGNLGECGFTGRISGKNAAAVKEDVFSDNVIGDKTPVDFSQEAEEITTNDNEYLGTATGMGGELTVKVTMDGDTIAAVEVVSNSETVGIADNALIEIPKSIVDAQSTEVDIVSGASMTSKAIIAAVENALSKIQ